jgi:hypothetical protein
MVRGWIAVACLAASWLFGMGYFAPARPLVAICLVVAAVVFFSGFRLRRPSWLLVGMGSGLLLPAVLLMPWPWKAIAVLLAIGLWVQRIPLAPNRWTQRLGDGAVIAAILLLVQAVTLHAYQVGTARNHELPGPLIALVAGVVGMLGVDVAVDGSMIVFREVLAQNRIAASWELLLDPTSVLFLVGGLAWLACYGSTQIPRGARGAWYRRLTLRLTLVWALWLPLRAALLIALVIHRTLRADPQTLPNVGDVFVNNWIHAGLMVPLAALAAIFLVSSTVDPAHRRGSVRSSRQKMSLPTALRSAGLVVAGVTIVMVAIFWVPTGKPQAGRIMFVERHSTWEPTIEPYGTEIYGEAGSYTYAAIYEFCGQFFQMSRLLEHEAIDDQRLAECDVLIIKTPTARYAPEEVDAVERFVRGGGGLLMIGDHTNVFNMNTYLNDVSRRFGFTFRNDLLFCVSSPYEQKHHPPPMQHPALQHMPPLDFAVACSIDPGRSAGRMVIRAAGLWSLAPAYQEVNYHPQAEYRPEMQYGAWCQAWATYRGKGRVIGFGDSTLFSNFCTYQPGKAELFLGMVQWLNHRSWTNAPWAWWLLRLPSVLIGVLLAGWGIWMGWPSVGGRRLAMASGLAAWALATMLVEAWNRTAMPWPIAERPIPHVVIDREISEVPLFTGAFADDREGLGYGMLEQWIPRLGHSLSRRNGSDVFFGDALVIITPTRSVSDHYLDALKRFVLDGGHLLVIDSPDVQGSTALSLLEAFDMAAFPTDPLSQALPLHVLGSSCRPPMLASHAIIGGEPIGWWNDQVVAARSQHGQGMVTAIGFGSLFNDAAMGFHWLAAPDEETLERYEVLYALLRLALPPSPRQAESSSGD